MPKRPKSVEAYLPLKPIQFWVLLVLVDEPRHGYRILKEIERRSAGEVRLEPGNLYRYLRRLLDDELLEEVPTKASEDERRRTYAVTELGRSVVRAEADRMRALVHAADGTVGA